MKPIKPKALPKWLEDDLTAQAKRRNAPSLPLGPGSARAILAALLHEREEGAKAERARCVSVARRRRTTCLDVAEEAKARRMGLTAVKWEARAAEAATVAAGIARPPRPIRRVSVEWRKA